MVKIIRQQKVYALGNSFYVLVPKEVREEADVNKDTIYNMTFDPKTKIMKVKFLKGD